MKKFRLISAVSVAVLSMSVQAMAMPLNANTSLQCTRDTAFEKCITNFSGSNVSTVKNCTKSLDIDSILKGLNDCGLKPSTIQNFNLNTGSEANATKKVNKKDITVKKDDNTKKDINSKKDNSSCDNGSCDDNSCDNGSCDDNSCDNGSCDNGSCDNGSCDNGSCDNGSANNGTANNGTANNGTANNGTANNGSANNGSANNGSANNGSNSNNTQDTSSSISAYAQKVVDLVNAERAKQGISPLSIDADVTEAAQVRAKEIQTSFSHTRPDGRSCFTALAEAGASYKGAGENIALGQKTPEQVMNDWMNSEGHRKNIMNPNFKYIGVGVDGTAWTQMFTY